MSSELLPWLPGNSELAATEPTSLEQGRDGAGTEPNDDELMTLAQRGASGAFDKLIRRHQARVMRVAAYHLRHPNSAPDVAQKTFLGIFEALHAYEPRGSFRAYLYRVLLNQCRMENRAVGARSRMLAAVRARQEVDVPERPDRESVLALDRAIEQLSLVLREVVVLRYCAGLSHDEIAQAVKAPVGSVRRRHFDAMGKLLELLDAGPLETEPPFTE
jgi:RNA polymerase sigma-70 factor (ECF subfamily)